MIQNMRLTLCVMIFISAFESFAADFHSPRTASLGGAGHASPLGNDSIYLNPGYTPFVPTSSLGMYWTAWQTAGGAYGRNYAVTIQDGKSEAFQAGLAHTQRDDGRFIHVGVSKSFIQRTGFGLGTKFYFPNNANWMMTDLTIGFSGLPTYWLQLALVVDNIFESEYGRNLNLTREWILGTRTNLMGIVTLYMDPIYLPSLPDANRWAFEGGAEFHVLIDLNLRAGWFYNSMVPYLSRRDRGYSVGAGWNGPRISIDYAHTWATTADGWSNNISATMFF